MYVTRPATVGCPQEELIGGDGVQAGVRRPHPGGSDAQTEGGYVRHATPRSLRWPPAVQD
jgi:hypothetical protein